MTAGLHVEAAGASEPDALPWVLLHGWGLNLRVFDGLASALAAGGERVLRIDLPGHGRSAFDERAVSFDAQVSVLLEALLDALPDRARIAGWSLGGQFALALARRAPHRVAGLVLIASTPRFVASADWPSGMKPAFLDAFAARLATDWRAVLDEFLALQVRGSRDAADVLRSLHAALEAQGAPDPRALAAGLSFLRDNDFRDAARGIACPTLLISGQHDRVAHPAASAWLAAAMPHARHVELPRAGHAPFLSHPIEMLAAMRAFAADSPA